MYVRLAFAVAAHLEPEILIVDEVLAVGDAQFQKKCLGKMEDVAGEGRTVIFVSHQMGTITQLCNKGIYLKQGSVISQGKISDVVREYVTTGSDDSGLVEFQKKDSQKKISCRRISISSGPATKPVGEVDVRHPFYINVDYMVNELVSNIEVSIRLSTSDGRAVLTTHQSDCSPEIVRKRLPGLYRSSIRFPGMFLMPGSYLIYLGIHEPMVQVIESHENIMSFNVLETGTKFARYSQCSEIGVVIQDLPWNQVSLESDGAKFIFQKAN
jgi:lipopolysaccharide transport system ATP-binding protein